MRVDRRVGAGSTAVLLLSSVGEAAAVDAEQLARTYRYSYIGEVMPTPQKASYADSYLPVFEVGSGRGRVSITLRGNATAAERIGAQEIANRVAFLAGAGAQLQITVGPEADTPLVSLGTGPFRLPRLNVPDRPEAYAVGASDDHEGVAVLARDPLGLYWGCQSLIQLLAVRDDLVVLREADIVDYPLFQVRSFKIGGGHDAIEDMGLWAPSAKFNTFNVCYTTVGRDLWPNPSQEYRQLVQRLCSQLLPRKLDVMLFVNPYFLWKEHIQTSDPADLDALAGTCSIALEKGARKVMLCLDDFASEPQRGTNRLYRVRHEKDREVFGDDLAKANVALLNGWYQRMKSRFPAATFLTVLPYYWLPGGAYREEGERCLREIGRGTPEDLAIVWTGPQVRSKHVDQASLAKYTALIGRQPFLWDNTLYAWHNPPHYFLDEFKTSYPDEFWAKTELGCHYNAGGGEAYKAGLFCVADYLWNPEAYGPGSALRKAVAIVGGSDCVDLLLEFRDVFYDIRDGRMAGLGDPAAFLKAAGEARASPLDAEDIRVMRAHIQRLPELAAAVGQKCRNAALVAEIQERSDMGAQYLEALAILEELPGPTEAETGNLIENTGAEDVSGNRPAGFDFYGGAGKLTLTSSEDAHSGERAACLRATDWYVYPDGREWINVAMTVGGSNGYTAGDAIEVEPFCKYNFSFWAKSDLPTWELSAVGWREGGGSGARQNLRTKPEEIRTSTEWRRYTGSFVTLPGTTRAALKIGITGDRKDGAKLGTIWVDDAYVGRGKP